MPQRVANEPLATKKQLLAWVLWRSCQVKLGRPMADRYFYLRITITFDNWPCECKTFNHKIIIPALEKTTPFNQALYSQSHLLTIQLQAFALFASVYYCFS